MEAEVNKKGPGEAYFVPCDVSKVDQIKSTVDATIAKYGRLDCLINNAGWHPPHKYIDDFSVEDFRSLLDLNLVSIFAACKFALRHLRKTNGNIINTSGQYHFMGKHGPHTYLATNA